MRERVLFFDLLRCVAAITVIAIHVLAPYRHEMGIIPFDQWATAVTVNSFSRWAVPVFILITGALLLSDSRPFDGKYYLKRRLGKVLLPLIVWSIFYAYLAGWSIDGFNIDSVTTALKNSLKKETYYHLGFFYYFIPLYLLIPFFQFFVKSNKDHVLIAYVVIWLVASTLFLFQIDGIWSYEMWLYSGYLPLGYLLYKKKPTNKLMLITMLGVSAAIITVTMVITLSFEEGRYTVGRWLSYKTINTITIASMVFMLCQYYAKKMPHGMHNAVGFISKHSLGIYMLHPIFLWPAKVYGWDQGHPAWEIPLWVIISGSLSLLSSWVLSKSTKTRWLLP